MKRFILMLLAAALAMGCCTAGAEVMIGADAGYEDIKTGSEVVIDDVCAFTLNSVKVYDTFLNMSSGDSKEFIVASVDLLNWKTEQLFVKAETAAQLVYDDSFEFENVYLWSGPEGTYYREANGAWLYVYDMDLEGKLYCSDGQTIGNGFETPFVKWNNTYYYYPDEDVFRMAGDTNESQFYKPRHDSKTVLDPLVERTMFYVFEVPNIVAEEEGLRVLTLTMCENSYSIRF